MIEFWYCHGIELDANYVEHTCKKRENCRYYDHDFYRKYAGMLDRCDFLVCFAPCPHFIPRREERKCGDDKNEWINAPIIGHADEELQNTTEDDTYK